MFSDSRFENQLLTHPLTRDRLNEGKVETKLSLAERGFAIMAKGVSKGKATVLAGPSGEPLEMQLVILKNGHIGGRVVLVPLAERFPNGKSFINKEEKVFEIQLDRTGNLVNITINEIDCNDLSITTYRTALFPDKHGDAVFVESDGMINSAKGKILLTTILADAVNRGIERSYDPKPEKLYYGKLALNVEPQDWRVAVVSKKEKCVMVDA